MFQTTPDDLDMHVIYDVSHNIAKVEEHFIDGRQKSLLVHRKGSTRAFPPHHPLIPVDYQVGQRPALKYCEIHLYFTILVYMYFVVDWSAGVDRRDDGNVQLRVDWNGTRHARHVRLNLPRSREFCPCKLSCLKNVDKNRHFFAQTSIK